MDQRASPTDDNLLELIVRSKPGLRKSDARVADVVLDRPAEAVNMTLANLAKAAGVSEPTVIRFCVAIGCQGYRDMRARLARSLAFARTTSHTAISSEDDLPTIITKVFDYNLSNLNWAQGRLKADHVEAAVQLLADARRIEFLGVGASGIVALDAQQKFPLFGCPCGAPSDAHQMFMTADMLGPGDVAMAISNTGNTREVREAVAVARARGARTIALTGNESAFVEHCDIVLVVETLENTDLYTPTVSRLSHLVVIDILATAVSLRRDSAHHDRLRQMKASLARLRSGKGL